MIEDMCMSDVYLMTALLMISFTISFQNCVLFHSYVTQHPLPTALLEFSCLKKIHIHSWNSLQKNKYQ